MDYTGAWWQVYIIVGGLIAIPLMGYYWKVDGKFRVAIGKGVNNPELPNIAVKLSGAALTLLITYTLFMVIWPFLIALPIIEKGLEKYG